MRRVPKNIVMLSKCYKSVYNYAQNNTRAFNYINYNINLNQSVLKEWCEL